MALRIKSWGVQISWLIIGFRVPFSHLWNFRCSESVNWCEQLFMMSWTRNQTINCQSWRNCAVSGSRFCIFKVKITKASKFTMMLTNEIISILINSFIFIIFTSFQDIESIPWCWRKNVNWRVKHISLIIINYNFTTLNTKIGY